jgi:hypothetical protein
LLAITWCIRQCATTVSGAFVGLPPLVIAGEVVRVIGVDVRQLEAARIEAIAAIVRTIFAQLGRKGFPLRVMIGGIRRAGDRVVQGAP